MKAKLFFAHALGLLAATGSLERADWLLPKEKRKPTPEELQQSVDRQDAAKNKRARKAEKRREILRKLEERQNA